MSIENLDVSTLLNWSNGKRVITRSGPKIVHEAVCTPEFTEFWLKHEQQLRSNGLSRNRHFRTGQWMINWWRNIPKAELMRIEKNIEASMRVEATIEIPKPDNGMDYYKFQKAGIQRILEIFRKL